MYELTSFLTTIAAASASFVAILGGFIASKLISIDGERNENLDRIKEIDEEIEHRTKNMNARQQEIDEEDATGFIFDNFGDFRNGYEFYLFNQTNNNPHWYNVKLYYHSTLLYTVDAVSLDGGRCFTSTAQTGFLNLKMHDDVSYKCFVKGTLRYAVHNFYITSDREYSEEAYARNRYLECVLIFESQEEKEAFNRFAREKYNLYRNENIERIQTLLPHFGEIKGYNMSVFKRQYEEALLLKELLNVFRGEE